MAAQEGLMAAQEELRAKRAPEVGAGPPTGGTRRGVNGISGSGRSLGRSCTSSSCCTVRRRRRREPLDQRPLYAGRPGFEPPIVKATRRSRRDIAPDLLNMLASRLRAESSPPGPRPAEVPRPASGRGGRIPARQPLALPDAAPSTR
jgi:hypothetical protein